MNDVNHAHVLDGLSEFSSIELQREYWLGIPATGLQGSFREAIEQLFGDSNLGSAMGSRPIVYSEQLDADLEDLYRLTMRSEFECRAEDQINHPLMREVRARAASILERMNAMIVPDGIDVSRVKK